MKRLNDERPDHLRGYPPLSAVDRHQIVDRPLVICHQLKAMNDTFSMLNFSYVKTC